MKRLPLLILLLLLAACSDEPAATTTTAEPTTTEATAAPEQEANPESTTTTQAPITTSAPSTELAFDALPGTPPAAFDSYAAEMTMSMAFGEVGIDVTTDGVWTGDAFECTITSGIGGIGFSESVIATTERLWVDSGSGYEETGLFASSAQEIMASCPASPLFWASFQTDELRGPVGVDDVLDGRPVTKFDIGGLVGGADLGALAGFPGATINDLVVWFDTETEAVVAMVTDMAISEELAAEIGAAGTGALGIVMEFTITQINDPTLSIEVPG